MSFLAFGSILMAVETTVAVDMATLGCGDSRVLRFLVAYAAIQLEFA